MNDVIAGIHRKILNDQDEKVIAWLGLNDTSMNHDLAREKHEPKTGDWFLESDMFMTRENSRKTSLWLQGKAGSGKTILCSTIIEHIKGICDSNPSYQYAYFYFDFNENQKQTVVGLLRSMILQLCVGNASLPTEVHELYKQCTEGHQQPTLQGLIKVFSSLFTDSVRTFLIMDALDECNEREELMKIISQIVNNSSGMLNLLMTSGRNGI